MWRSSLHNNANVGLFNEKYTSAGDAEFWYRVSRNNSNAFGSVSIPLNLYYQNPNGISTKPNTIGAEEHRIATKKHYAHLKSRIYKYVGTEFVENYLYPSRPEELQIHSLAKKFDSLK